MAVSGLVRPGVEGREETQLPAPSVVPVLLLLLPPPAFASASADLNFHAPKRCPLLALPPSSFCHLFGGCADPPNPWMKGPVPRLGPQVLYGESCVLSSSTPNELLSHSPPVFLGSYYALADFGGSLL